MPRSVPKDVTGTASSISCLVTSGVLDPSVTNVQDSLSVLSNMFDPTDFVVTPGLVSLTSPSVSLWADQGTYIYPSNYTNFGIKDDGKVGMVGNVDLVLITNDLERLKITSGGNIIPANLTPSRLVSAGVSKELVSTDLINWIAEGYGIVLTDLGDGRVEIDIDTTGTISIHNNLSGRNAVACHPASSIELDHLSTYTTLQDFINMQSSGLISGGHILDNGDGTVNVESGSGFIKITDESITQTLFFDWADSTSVVLEDNNLNYIYIDYNDGSPIIGSTSNFGDLNQKSKFSLGRVYRIGTELHIVFPALTNCCFSEKLQDRLFEVYGLRRASGCVVTEIGERYISVTSGVTYISLNRRTTEEFDSTSNSFIYTYRDGAGGWTRTFGQSQIDNLHYDDGGVALGNLTPGKYGVHWVFIEIDGGIEIVYGQGDYTLTEAELAVPPSELPPHLTCGIADIIAKIIIEQNSSNITSIETPTIYPFTTSVVFAHNDLGSLQGGQAGQFYHQTYAQNSLYTVNGLVYPQNSGAKTLVDMPVTSDSVIGTEESYSFKIDGVTLAKIYAESNGAGGIQNHSIRMSYPVNISTLTNSRLVSSDGSKNLVSSNLVNWVSGSISQIYVSDDGDGSVTLSLPQDIDTTSVVAFGGMSLYGNLNMSGNNIDMGGGSILNLGPSTISFIDNVGTAKLIDFNVTSDSTAGLEQSISMGIDGTNFIKMYAESDGLGGIQNATVTIMGFEIVTQGNSKSIVFSEIMVNDSVGYDIPGNTRGWGFIVNGGGDIRALFSWNTSANVELEIKSGDIVNTDTTNRLCIFNNGTNVRVRNRLGSDQVISFWVWYS